MNKELRLKQSFKEYDIYKCNKKIEGINEKIKVLEELKRKTLKKIKQFKKELK